jgi:hypothetical protein
MESVFVTPFMWHRGTGQIIPPSKPTTVEIDDPVEFLQPQQKIWRYMSCEKFLDLVRKRTLYCRRLDKLPDCLEGLYSAGNFKGKSKVMQAIHDGYKIKDDHDSMILQSIPMRMHYFVNCWHINDAESRTMWRLYAPSSESIVVVSRAGLLTDYALFCCIYGSWALTGKVNYVDYNYTRPDWVSYGPAFCKDLPYRFEQEFRLAISDKGTVHADFLRYSVDSTPLIEKVILHPHASAGFARFVRMVLSATLPHVPVITSRIKSRLW